MTVRVWVVVDMAYRPRRRAAVYASPNKDAAYDWVAKRPGGDRLSRYRVVPGAAKVPTVKSVPLWGRP